jgi:large repetitive protein
MKNSSLFVSPGRVAVSVLFVFMTFIACDTGSSSGGGSASTLFSDDFDGSDATWLNDWYYMGGTNFTSNYTIYHETGANGSSYCMNLYGGYGNLNVYAYTEVSSAGITPTSVSYYMKTGSTGHECGVVRLYSSDGYDSLMCYFGTTYLTLYTSGAVNIQTYTADTWYHIEFRNINWTAHTFDFYVNDSLKTSGAGFVSTSSNDAMNFEILNFTTYSDFYIDEIVMK